MRYLVILYSLVSIVSYTLLNAAPIPPKEDWPISADELLGLVGKDHFSPEVTAIRKASKEDPKATYSTIADACFYHDWKDCGLCLRFNQDCKIERILLYSGRTPDHLAYKGELPFNLSISNTMAQVETTLGKPDETNVVPKHVRCIWNYPKKGLVVEFDTFMADDVTAKISYVGLLSPKSE